MGTPRRAPPPSLGRLSALRVSLLVSVGLFLWTLDMLSSLGGGGAVAIAFLVYLVTGGHYTLYLVWNTLPRDIRSARRSPRSHHFSATHMNDQSVFRGAYRYLRLLGLMYSYQRQNLTVPRVFSQTVSRFGRRKCLVHLDRSWTFLDLEEYSNKVANFFLAEGYKPGECIALQMHNRPVRRNQLVGSTVLGKNLLDMSRPGVRGALAGLCQNRRRSRPH